MKKFFISVIEKYGIDTDGIYDDFSELEKILWRGNKLVLSVISERTDQLYIVIKVRKSYYRYSNFECELKEFDKKSIQELIKFAQDNHDALSDNVLENSNDVNIINISIGNRKWSFKRR